MTILQFIKKNGIMTDHVETLKRWSSVDVNFINSDGKEDETQLDVEHVCTKKGNDELSNLFTEFCKENEFPNNTVTGITIVRSSNTLDALD